MKTLFFCTTYMEDIPEWELRCGQWIVSAKTGLLNFDKLLIIDDGSPILPGWADVTITQSLPEKEIDSEKILYHFSDNLGRQAIYVYPGWYRSFMFAAQYAQKYSYDKVIHVESDSAIISNRMQEYINNFNNGWEVFWCPRHQIPETAIQVIAGDSLKDYYQISNIPYSTVRGRPADPGAEQGPSWLKYKTINKQMIGDRYGETSNIVPKNADFACQLRVNTDYWWIYNK